MSCDLRFYLLSLLLVQVDICCFDKTGTLTSDDMVCQSCHAYLWLRPCFMFFFLIIIIIFVFKFLIVFCILGVSWSCWINSEHGFRNRYDESASSHSRNSCFLSCLGLCGEQTGNNVIPFMSYLYRLYSFNLVS